MERDECMYFFKDITSIIFWSSEWLVPSNNKK